MKLRAFIPVNFTAATLSLTGYIGFGHVPSFSIKSAGGKPIARSDAAFIVPGKTSRAEVIIRLGTQNCRESVRIAAMAYGCEMPGGHGFFFYDDGYSEATKASGKQPDGEPCSWRLTRTTWCLRWNSSS